MMDQESNRSTGIVLTPAQVKSRKARNLAIGLVVGFLVVLFYVVTIAKLGGAVLRQGG